MNTSGRWFREDSYPSKPLKLMSVSAGEFVGALDYALSELSPASGLDEVPLAGPRWLKSGVDTFLKDRALAEGGVISYDTKRNSLVESAKYVGKQPLSEMETRTGFSGIQGDAYDYSAMAGELLASLAGESSLIKYYANLKIGTTWQKEFQKSFGMTVDKFYEVFEEHRAAGFPELTLTPTPKQDVLDYVRWEIGSEVSVADEQNARQAVQLVHDYAVSLGMPEIKEDITFYLYHNHDALFAAYARATGVSVDYSRDHWDDGDGTGEAGQGWAIVNTSNSWVREDPLNLMRISAGEFVGALAYDLSDFFLGGEADEVPKGGPRWLSSGILTILEIKALEEGGVISYDTARNGPFGLVESAKYVGKVPLSEIETWGGFIGIRGSAYNYSTMAAELLASLAGESSLIKYYANLKVGTTWQKEFQKSFGMTVDKFYEVFDEHRDAGFPELTLTPTPEQNME